MAGENETQDTPEVPGSTPDEPGEYNFAGSDAVDPETAFMRNMMSGEYSAEKVFYQEGETPQNPPPAPETPTEPAPAAAPQEPPAQDTPAPQASAPSLPEGLGDLIEKGDVNEILTSVYKAAGKEFSPKKSVTDAIIESHPDIVFDSEDAVIDHVQKQIETASTLQKQLNQWDALLDRVPRFKGMLQRLAEDPELSEDTLALAAYDDLLKVPEDASDEELDGLVKSLKSSKEQLDQRAKARSERETKFQEQVDYHTRDLTGGVEAFMQEHKVDQATANKVLGVVQTILFGDRYGNRLPADKLLPIIYRGVYFDRLAKSAEPDAEAQKAEVTRLATEKVNQILDELRKKGGNLNEIPRLEGGQIPTGPAGPRSEFAGVRDPANDVYQWN